LLIPALWFLVTLQGAREFKKDSRSGKENKNLHNLHNIKISFIIGIDNKKLINRKGILPGQSLDPL